MSLFTPRGEQPQWKPVYDLFTNAEDNALVSHERIIAALGFDPSDPRTKNRAAVVVRKAGQVLEREDHRAIRSRRGEGYVVVSPEAHLELAQQHHRKAGKSLARGHSKVTNVDLNRVSDPEVRKAFEVMGMALVQQMEINRKVASKIKKHDWALEQLSIEVTKTKEETLGEVDDLRTQQEKQALLLRQVAERLGIPPLESS